MRPLSEDSVSSPTSSKCVRQRIRATRASRLELMDRECEKTIGHAKKKPNEIQARLLHYAQPAKVKIKSSDFSLALSNNRTESSHAPKSNHHKTSWRLASDRQHNKWKLICRNTPGSSTSKLSGNNTNEHEIAEKVAHVPCWENGFNFVQHY